MPLRILIIGFLLYLLWRLVSRELLRFLRKAASPPPGMAAIDTIQCPYCHTYVPADAMHNGHHADCPFPPG